MAGTNQHYVIYLEPYRIYIYGSQMDQIIPLDLPTTVVRDLELLARDQITSLIDQCITTTGLGPGPATLVLSERHLFEKELLHNLSDENKKAEAIREYIENVPFEQVSYITYPTQNGLGVIATNEELFMAIKRAFDKKDIEVNLIVPVRAFGAIQINPQTGLDMQTAAFFLQNADQTKPYAFHVKELPITPRTIAEKKKADNKQAHKRMPIYLSVFGFLILVLLVMVVVMRQPPANKPTVSNVDAQAPAAALQPTEPPPAQGTSSATFDRSVIRIQIKSPPLFRTQIDEIKSKLTAAGYGSVEVSDSSAASNTVLFLDKSKLTQKQRDAIAAELKIYAPHLTVQEVEQATSDAVLTVGKEL